jgi:pimeloyl-ACP methyl ester carboxylesterase
MHQGPKGTPIIPPSGVLRSVDDEPLRVRRADSCSASVLEMTQHCVAFLGALGLEEIDIVGFSLGGMIAQQLTLDHPRLVRRVILLGTGPRGGEGMTFTELSPSEQGNPEILLLGAFFSPTSTSQAAGKALIQRLKARKEYRDPPVSTKSASDP